MGDRLHRNAQLRLGDYLGHILDAIERVQRYTAGMERDAFDGQELVQDAVVRNMEVIGEAAHNVIRRFPEFAPRHGDLPWLDAYEVRNACAHGYYRVDLGVVWRTLERDLPELQKRIGALRDELLTDMKQ